MKTIDIPTDNPLEMVWAIREKIYEETKDMSWEEYGEYLRRHCESFEKKLKNARAERLDKESSEKPDNKK